LVIHTTNSPEGVFSCKQFLIPVLTYYQTPV
jgi:hypothetical protein